MQPGKRHELPACWLKKGSIRFIGLRLQNSNMCTALIHKALGEPSRPRCFRLCSTGGPRFGRARYDPKGVREGQNRDFADPDLP